MDLCKEGHTRIVLDVEKELGVLTGILRLISAAEGLLAVVDVVVFGAPKGVGALDDMGG